MLGNPVLFNNGETLDNGDKPLLFLGNGVPRGGYAYALRESGGHGGDGK